MSLLVDRKLIKIDEAIGRNMSDPKSKKHKTSFDASRCCTWQGHGFPPGQTTATLTWGHLDRRWMSQIGWFYPSWAWCGDWMQPQKIYRLTGSVKEETRRNCWDWFRADSLLFSGDHPNYKRKIWTGLDCSIMVWFNGELKGNGSPEHLP